MPAALAFYQRESGDRVSAIATCQWLDAHPLDAEAILDLGLTHARRGDRAAAETLTIVRPWRTSDFPTSSAPRLPGNFSRWAAPPVSPGDARRSHGHVVKLQ